MRDAAMAARKGRRRRKQSLSRFLSYVLRHNPDAIGLTLDRQGWAKVDELLERARAAGVPLDRATLRRVVAENDKQRFALSPDGERIRARQGHSIPVDLGLPPVQPPEFLYHGTARPNLPSIRRQGLLRGKRHHVHLSPDEATALQVGRRHGEPVVLRIRAGEMHRDGYRFYLTENRVWLTEHVPPRYIDFPDGESPPSGASPQDPRKEMP